MHHNHEAPIANVLCARRELEYNKKLLDNCIKAPRGVYDLKSPRVFAHLENNAKKMTIQQDLQEKISYENALLMEKVARIMVPSNKVVKSATAFKPGTCIDMNQLPKIDHQNYYNLVSGYERTRLREHARIEKENQIYRRRIQEQKPTYSNQVFEAQNDAKNQYLHRIQRKLVTSELTPQEKKADSIRKAQETKRNEFQQRIYERQNINSIVSPRDVSQPFQRNQVCICIDNFEPRTKSNSQNPIFPTPPPRRPKQNVISNRASIAEKLSIAEELELETILAENESPTNPPSTNTSNDLILSTLELKQSTEISTLDTLSSITLSEMEFIREDFNAEQC
ncbi:hypothetical protein THRCLA_10235 [Thraustotheca clavata]|uniref:Uncharacterized protein n=1 Tax=Thraustotheca clavata TaxID=74557 RepID=A0A1V9YRZ3_9STRA|nr:hypothetical protein THRCLA_10235 [Thraustotheca clavata]